ncbi:ornithine decarboxylase 1-like [Pelobates fuscus]|uniref:ornithine decarboxylase 1-like n=1 Tax=Pelobates fuscus TaxID=191477 RepID=UPI002FE4AE42
MAILEDGTSSHDFLKEKLRNCISSGKQDPFLVADLGQVVHKHRLLMQELPRVKPFYAVKCNNSKEVLWTLAALGTRFDCASKSEIDLVLSIGVQADDIIYANPCKQVSYIQHAARHGVRKMTFDCESELVKMAEYYPKAEMILRINVDDSGAMCPFSRKFGASLISCEHLLETANNLNLDVIGVSFHIGSSARNPQAFGQAIKDGRNVFDIGNKLGHKMRLLDIGGGLPGNPSFQPSFEEFAVVINKALDQYFPMENGLEIIAEPGRYYVTSAGTLALNIVTKKVVNEKGEDGKIKKNISYYMNDGIFVSFLESILHKILLDPTSFLHLEEKLYGPAAPMQPWYRSILWGASCDEEDIIMDEVYLPELDVGDWIIFPNMGAYSVTLYSSYCGFPKLPVYYVISKEHWCILCNSNVIL